MCVSKQPAGKRQDGCSFFLQISPPNVTSFDHAANTEKTGSFPKGAVDVATSVAAAAPF